ncbi:LiaF transmembrane domain-containing protein [Scopulibacillus cellulosilyticus]|uniref:LiaF transmembrane domain-containing protein n=1 Tax=Scopulibacillus cellulosilyticus TaxID=2665665 RepID=A0ABW2Q7E3_9BACL
MSLNFKSLVGIILLLIGAVAFLGMLGIHIGGLIPFALSVILIYYGGKKLKTSSTGGQKAIGVTALIIGILMFVGLLPLLVTLAISAVLIYFGWKLIKDTKEPAPTLSGETVNNYKNVKFESSFDTEWKDFLKRHKDN